jgi:hypothetical protein
MIENIKIYFREFFSMSSSLAIHFLLLISFSSKIVINDITHFQKIIEQNGGASSEENFGKENEEIDLIIDLNSFKQTKKPTKKVTRIVNVSRTKKVGRGNKNSQNNIKIDQRGIYKGASKGGGTGSGKESSSGGSAATLNIPGWTWDSQPVINDNSNEVGKIIFEFTIDDLGYVIGVKTLEKTVSSHVEKLYRDAVLNLTFKKIDKVQPQEETIGKITFLLQYSE